MLGSIVDFQSVLQYGTWLSGRALKSLFIRLSIAMKSSNHMLGAQDSKGLKGP